MNPSRLVAALAALSVGFGITLVGVSITDPDATDESIEMVAEENSDSVVGGQPDSTPSPDSADEPVAEEEVEPAVEPEQATTEEDLDVAEPPVDVEEPDADVEEPDAGRTPIGADQPIGGREDDRPPLDCFEVVIIESVSGQTVLQKAVDYQIVGGEITLLDGVDVDERALDGSEEISIAIVNGMILACSDGRPMNSRVLDDYYLSSSPCDGDVRRYFVSFFDSLDIPEGDTFGEEAVFVEVVAERLERVDDSRDNLDTFIDGVDDSFAGFVEECPDGITEVDLESDSEFFCAVARLASTDDLLTYLLPLVPDAVSDCEYDA